MVTERNQTIFPKPPSFIFLDEELFRTIRSIGGIHTYFNYIILFSCYKYISKTEQEGMVPK